MLRQFLTEDKLFGADHLDAIAVECADTGEKVLSGHLNPREAMAEIMGMLGLMFAYFGRIEARHETVLATAAEEFNEFVAEGIATEQAPSQAA